MSKNGILSNLILSENDVNALVFRYRCSLDMLMTFEASGLFISTRRQEIDKDMTHVKDLFKGLKFVETPGCSPFALEFFEKCTSPYDAAYLSSLTGHCSRSAQMQREIHSCSKS